MLLPISDISIGAHWTLGTGSLAYALLDEGNAHNAGVDTVTCTNSGSLGGELKLGFQTPSGLTTSLKIRIYITTNSGDLTGTLYINGAATGGTDLTLVPDQGGSGGWVEFTWSGNWPTISSLELGLKLTNTFSSCVLDSLYFEPTISIPACTPTYESPDHTYMLDESGLTSVCLDSTGTANGTYSGSLTFGASSITNDGGTSVKFSGGKIILPASAFQSYNTLTVSCWCIWTGGVEGQRLFDFSNGSNKYMYFTPNHSDTDKPRFGLSLTGSLGEIKLDAPDAFPLNQKVFVACVFDGSQAYLYINGVLKSSKTAGITLVAIAPTACYIAGHPTLTSGAFLGSIDRLSFHAKALAKSNIDAIVACLKTEPAVGYLGVEEALIISDTVKVNMIWARGISDSVNISDNKGPKKSVSDTLSFGETTNLTSRLVPQVTDDFNLAEAAQVQNGFISQRTDLIVFSDTVKAYKTLIISDTLAFTDDLSQPNIKWQVLGHTLALNDTLAFQIPGKHFVYLTDSLSLIETVTRVSNRYTFKDQLYFIDSVLESGVPDRRSLSETLVFSEGLSTTLKVFKITEPISFADVVRSKFNRFSLKDTLDLTEKLRVSPAKLKLDDTLTFGDSLTFITNHPYLSESLTLTDIVKYRLAITNKELSDTLTLMEKLQYRPNPIRITDTLTFTETVNRTFPISFADSLALIDTARRFFGNAFVDTLTLNETLLARPSKRLQDALILLDMLCVSHIGINALVDTLGLQEFATYTLNNATTPPTIGDSGFGVTSSYAIEIADELLLAEQIKTNAPPCNGGGFI